MNTKFLFFIIMLALIFTSSHRSIAATLKATPTGKSIQLTIDSATPGDTVIVADGTYVENISITKPIKLLAASDSNGAVISAKDPSLPVITIDATTSVTITGLKVNGSLKETGILVQNSTKVTVINCTVTKNRIGIALIGSESNLVSGNRAEFNETYGIYLERSSRNTVTENIAGQNLDKGIFLSYANENSITKNNTNHNKWNGILLWDSHDNEITDNKAYRNTYSIIESESSGNLYDGNSTLPNLYLILPIIMIYTGVIFYMLQRLVIGNILRVTRKKK